MLRIFLLLLLILNITICNIFAQQTHNLDYYINQGLQNSPLIKDYQYQISSGVLDSLILKTQLKPQAAVNANIMIPSVINGEGYDKALTNGGNYIALIGVTQNIFYKKALSSQYTDININNKSVQNNSKITVNELKRDITQKYLEAYSDYNEILLNKKIIKLSIDQESTLKLFVNNGLYKQTDYQLYLIELENEKLQLKQSEQQFRNDQFELNILCGISDTNHYTLELPVIVENKKIDFNSSQLYQHFRIDSLKIANQKAITDAKYYPKFNLFADAGLESSDLINANKNLGFSFGLNCTMPIYDGKLRNLEYKKSAISENIRVNYRDFFKTQYNQQVLQKMSGLKSTKELINETKKQLEMSESLIVNYRQLLEKGEVSITDLIIAVRNDINIHFGLNKLQINELQTINEINFLTQ